MEYPLGAAKAFSTLTESFNFVYVSGEWDVLIIAKVKSNIHLR